MKDPAIQRLVEEMMPEYFERREQQIDEVADLQKQIALLLLYGPRSKSDLLLEYSIRNGKLNIPQGAIWEPEKWYNADKTAFNNMTRGMFNPRRYATAPQRPAMRDRWNIDPSSNLGNASPFFQNGRSTYNVGADIAARSGAPNPPFA
jgi:hypothetical protein